MRELFMCVCYDCVFQKGRCHRNEQIALRPGLSVMASRYSFHLLNHYLYVYN